MYLVAIKLCKRSHKHKHLATILRISKTNLPRSRVSSIRISLRTRPVLVKPPRVSSTRRALLHHLDQQTPWPHHQHRRTQQIPLPPLALRVRPTPLRPTPRKMMQRRLLAKQSLRRQVTSRNSSKQILIQNAYPFDHKRFLCSYAQFQISDGVAGNADVEANAVFVGECPCIFTRPAK